MRREGKRVDGKEGVATGGGEGGGGTERKGGREKERDREAEAYSGPYFVSVSVSEKV